MRTDDTYDLIDSFLIDGGYTDERGEADLSAWMEDSDYEYVEHGETLPQGWYNVQAILDGDDSYDGAPPVDPIETVLGAIEACGFTPMWEMTVKVVSRGATPDEALADYIANGSPLVAVEAYNADTGRDFWN